MSHIDPRTKIFYHLDRLTEIQQGRVPPPVNVEIDLTNRCNLGCGFCHFGYTHTRGPLAGRRSKPKNAISGGDVMDYRLAIEIMLDLMQNGVRSITWTGGGEPTLHPYFDSIIATTDGNLDQGIYTNGTLIDKERAALLKLHMTWVYVSLDAWDEASYKAIKSTPVFKKACQGVKNLAAASGKATIGVGFLITKDNYKWVAQMYDLAMGLGADYVQFRPTVLFDQAAPGKLVEDTQWLSTAWAWLDMFSRRPNMELDLDRFEMYRNWRGHGYPICWWSAVQTVITPNGKVWTCVNKREHPNDCLGDLTKQSFADIWAARNLAMVNKDCRVLCRGHLANTALNAFMYTPSESHSNFI